MGARGILRAGGSLATGLALAACASVAALGEAPRVSLVSIEPREIHLLEQRFEATLRIRNPNERALAVRGMDCEIEINGHTFADGVSGDAFRVPAFGEALVRLDLSSSLARVVEQLRALEGSGRPVFRYSIRGGIALEGTAGTIPFAREGEIDLGPGTGGGGGAGTVI